MANGLELTAFLEQVLKFLDAVGKKYYYFADIHSNTLVWIDRPQTGLLPYKGRGPYLKKQKAS